MLPTFPKTPHLPNPKNAEADDLVEENASIAFTSRISVEEKIDGASVGFTLHDGHPVVRNRDHILGKGFLRKTIDTTAKMQFRSIWTWFYDNKSKFHELCDRHPFSIYGEWMVAQHGIFYNNLPDWFIAYDIYDYEAKNFLAPHTARRLLQEAGFVVPELLGVGEFTEEDLEELANGPAAWADDKREGVYIKVDNSEIVTHRFKLVREDFQRGSLWDNKEMKRNEVAKNVAVGR